MNCYTYAKMLKKAAEETNPAAPVATTADQLYWSDRKRQAMMPQPAAPKPQPQTEQPVVEPAGKDDQGNANMLNENWNKLKNYLVKNRSWALPTATGIGTTGLSYAGLGLIPAMRRNTVLRLLASGAIGAATAGGAYYLDNVHGKQKPKAQA